MRLACAQLREQTRAIAGSTTRFSSSIKYLVKHDARDVSHRGTHIIPNCVQLSDAGMGRSTSIRRAFLVATCAVRYLTAARIAARVACGDPLLRINNGN